MGDFFERSFPPFSMDLQRMMSLSSPGDRFRTKSCINRASVDNVVPTTHPGVFCSKLPHHWRSNKSLPSLFQVVVMFQDCHECLGPTKEGARIWLTASNQFIGSAVLRNSESRLVGGEARFNDLRFVSRSGRGKYFDLHIHIEGHGSLDIVATYPSAIKVTVDGPREPRNKHKGLSFSKTSFNLFRGGTTNHQDPGLFSKIYSQDLDSSLQRTDPLRYTSPKDEKRLPLFPVFLPHHQFQGSPSPSEGGTSFLNPDQLLRLMMMATMYRMNPPNPQSLLSESEKKESNHTKIWRPF